MMDGKICLPAPKAKIYSQGVIKITEEAFEALAEVMNETGMASMIIVQAVQKDLIVYERRAL